MRSSVFVAEGESPEVLPYSSMFVPPAYWHCERVEGAAHDQKALGTFG